MMANKATAKTQPTYTKPAPNKVNVKLIDHSGRYVVGPARRPNIIHDNGFLDKFSLREPTVTERLSYAEWRAKASAGSAVGRYWNEKKKEWIYAYDAILAYKHWLEGSGTSRSINYKSFLADDESGRHCLRYMLDDFKQQAEVIGENRTRFSITSNPYLIGGRDNNLPYPTTENWQKAIGAHPVWVSGTVEITYDKNLRADVYRAHITLHIEDRYNFNPGMKDIGTGKPDSDNGVFEITGLAKQYLNLATETFNITWSEQRHENPFGALK